MKLISHLIFKPPLVLQKDVGRAYFKMVPDFYILLIAEALSMKRTRKPSHTKFVLKYCVIKDY